MGGMKRSREDYIAGGEVSLGYRAPSWSRGQLLGRGGFGSVFVAKLKKPCLGFPPIMAVKSENTASESSSLSIEQWFLRALKGCPNVVQYFGSDFTTTSSGDIIYNIFLELASGSLADFIKKYGSGIGMPEVLVRNCTRSILIGLKQVHDRGFVHCDIKPHNVLLVPNGDGYVAKVADFGLAKRQNVRDASGVRGTPLFFSPEMVRYGIQEAASDIWALGCSVLMMLTGKPPWASTRKSELMSRIATESPTIPPHISKAAQNFLSCCFVRHSVKRLTATELLSHIFLLESDEGEEVYIEEKAKVSDEKSLEVKPQSERCPSALPSFIPLPSSSSEEEEEDIPAAAKRTCYRQIHPVAIMGCQPPVTFTVRAN
ncbi:hypothetical protein RGQ29_031439 [Quercus rubra]|uniref:Protein kinase domain-containing protein n=1 Tax=Quercus rubra TaxID=3512 RepID=A0AAN7IBZ9_QUERU|nr:hypothetical protein RGQ29_031439 [Quercus rubra]